MVLLKYTNLHQFSFIILINLLIKYCLFETSEEFCKKYDKDSQSSCLMIQNWVQERDGFLQKSNLLNPEPPSAPRHKCNFNPDDYHNRQDKVVPPSFYKPMYDCLDIPCYCKAIGGNDNHNGTCTIFKNHKNITFGKAVRKEYRTLTSEERNKLHHCFNVLKFNYTYNNFVYMHQAGIAIAAHAGPTFPLFHREYLKRLEFELRQVDPDCVIPYWDSSMDTFLDDQRDSCLWTKELMGVTVNKTIINGDFCNWTAITGEALSREFKFSSNLIDPYLVKRILAFNTSSIMGFTDSNYTTNNPNCTNIAKAKTLLQTLEHIHGRPHNFVGGHMATINTSANDPIFFLHHCFIDYLYEEWRILQIRQKKDPYEMYPESEIVNDHCAQLIYSRKSPMNPFYGPKNITNEWGLRADYTQNLYTYESPPTCNKTHGCGSPFLFCTNVSFSLRCVSKIRIGGNCESFSNLSRFPGSKLSDDELNPCYKGHCKLDENKLKCVNDSWEQPNDHADIPTYTNTTIKKPKIDFIRKCYDNHECCPRWSEDGYCKNGTNFMNIWCPASCAIDGCMPKSKKTDIGCMDQHSLCQKLLENNKTECFNNEHWMSANCAKSCKKCDTIESCGGGPGAKGYYYNITQLDLPRAQIIIGIDA